MMSKREKDDDRGERVKRERGRGRSVRDEARHMPGVRLTLYFKDMKKRSDNQL
jgi:hypothetical protein